MQSNVQFISHNSQECVINCYVLDIREHFHKLLGNGHADKIRTPWEIGREIRVGVVVIRHIIFTIIVSVWGRVLNIMPYVHRIRVLLQTKKVKDVRYVEMKIVILEKNVRSN